MGRDALTKVSDLGGARVVFYSTYDWAASDMAPSDPSFQVLLPLCNLLPLHVAQPSDLLLMNRISHK